MSDRIEITLGFRLSKFIFQIFSKGNDCPFFILYKFVKKYPLKELLQQSLSVLKPGGRIAIITFHSLEDRIVKNFFRDGTFEDTAIDDLYGHRFENPLQMITKKPVTATEKELKENTRSRSAKLRVAAMK